ncbi:MAG: glycosyltransferase family 2 protein [Thermoplasmatota archaeon]
MDVSMSGSRQGPRDSAAKVGLALVLVGLVLVPGFFLPVYFRVMSTLIFVGLGLIVARAYLAAFASFRRSPAPPEKPADVEWPTVSVLVPAFNESSVLERTMASMTRVDYPPDRIQFVYVAERRSSDGTVELVQGWAARDPRFIAVIRDERRGGKAAACNHGLDKCTGEILVSVDADHELEPGAVKRAVRHFLADSRLACVKGRSVGMNGRESYLALQMKVERDAIEKGDLYMRHVVRGFSFFGGGQAFFRRSLFETLGRFDEEILVEDIDFSIKIHQAGWRILVDPEIRSWEENPANLRAWWAQRKRWARGWMQVTRRYLSKVHRMERLSWRQKLDMWHTLAYVLIPIAFALLLPLNLIGHLGYFTSTYLPPAWEAAGWSLYGLAPFLSVAAMLVQDWRDGVKHEWREVPAFLTITLYLMLQTFTFWSAFLDEYMLRRPSVYVKTAKTGANPVAAVVTEPLITLVK